MDKPSFLSSIAIKRKQWQLFGGVIGGLGLAVILATCSMGDKSKKSATVAKQTLTPIALGSNHVEDGQIWLQRAENKLDNEQKDTEALKQKMLEADKQHFIDQQLMKIQDEKYNALLQKVDKLESDLTQTKQAASLTVSPDALIKGGYALPPPLPTNNTNKKMLDPMTLANGAGIKNDDLHLVKDTPAKPASDKNPKNYVPAGTFAKGVLLSGLDASVGVSSQTQPRPVLLRILDRGTLPNGHHSQLSNCFVTGAGYGDISSERAYIRLERMSCTKKDKQITDFPVYGYVSGSDGKAGVRGIPVWRENTLLQRSFISGLFSGLSQGVANTFTNTSTSALGSTQSVDASHVLQVGMATGASNSLNKLADYNIKRAEQYQPVIQVSAGSQVDVVFHTGFYLDGHTTNIEATTSSTTTENNLPQLPTSSTTENNHETD